jgi:NADH-quinone oxidoreductase subunit D
MPYLDDDTENVYSLLFTVASLNSWQFSQLPQQKTVNCKLNFVMVTEDLSIDAVGTRNTPATPEGPIQYVNELTTLNLGPTHPATHGIFQNILQMDGEKIVSGEQTVGYIHRAFEKIAERRPFYQITTLTDRMNYCSSPINNFGWMMTVEKLLGVEVPKRAQYIRVIMMELARIADHLICNGILGVDTGAFTGFLYLFEERENIYEIYEEMCGARLTTNMGRIGGMERDLSPEAIRKIRKFLKDFPAVMKEFEALFNRNRIFMDRIVDVGPITGERALSYGFTGPNLRAAGVDYDVRVMNPYSSYEDFEFDIPVGENGDTYDRFMVRNEEIWQSLRIIQQAIDKLPDGPYYADAPEYYLPPKQEVYKNMEALIYHFKIVMGEIDAPVGEIYHAVEGGNGELGFYLISDGGRAPYRLHFRRPCFIYYQAFPEMCKGTTLSDAIVIMSSLNVIAGELDA